MFYPTAPSPRLGKNLPAAAQYRQQASHGKKNYSYKPRVAGDTSSRRLYVRPLQESTGTDLYRLPMVKERHNFDNELN